LFIPSEDENDAAVNIWGSVPGDRVLRQKIITRNKSGRISPLGILDENIIKTADCILR
jgi:hypothetical protein